MTGGVFNMPDIHLLHAPGDRRQANDPPSGDRGVVVSIQYLRGLAAMAVGLSHIAGHPGLTFEIGAAGVDVFFVISGFIMWTVTSRRPTKPGSFMIDRLTRIAPPYMLLTITVYLIASYIPGAFPNMRTNLSHMILSALFIPHIDLFGKAFPQIVPGWTLTYELFFYLLFAGGLLAPVRQRAWICTAVISLLVVVGLLTHSAYEAVKTYTNPLLMEFAAGLWLGVAWNAKRLPSARWGGLALLVGLTAFVAWELLSGVQPQSSRAFVWGVPAFLIVAGLVTVELRLGLVRFPLLLLLGNASYSIYLVNVFVVAATWRVLAHISVSGYFVAAIIVSAAGGVVFWRIVERPITQLARHWFHRPAIMKSLVT
jgi:exopolysaccharide production protein ExoZ